MEELQLRQFTDTAISIVSVYGLQVIGALVILIVGYIAAGSAAAMVRRALTRASADVTLTGFASSLVRYAVLTFTVVSALAKFGVQTTSFIAVLGAAGFAVGLALQGSLSNFAAGVMLLVFRPFRIGDYIKAAGQSGSVANIGIFVTTLNTADNQRVMIPNATLTADVITNVNVNDTRRVDLTAGIGYGDSIGKAKTILERILTDHEAVLDDPAPQVAVSELADSSVNFIVRPWCKTEDYWTVYFDVTEAIKQQFDIEGVSIPFPQQDVHVHQVAAGSAG